MTTTTRSIRHRFLLATLALAALPMAFACASTSSRPALTAKPSANQQVIYEDGAEKIISMQPSSLVSLRLAEPSGGRSAFVVGVANQAKIAILIDPEMVKVSQLGRSLRVYTYEEVAEAARKKRETAMVTRSLLGAASAGLSSFGAMAPTMNFASAQSSLQMAQTAMATTSSNGEIDLKELATVSLKKNTLFPAQQGGGVVYAEKLGSGPLSIQVQVGTDVHEFHFVL